MLPLRCYGKHTQDKDHEGDEHGYMDASCLVQAVHTLLNTATSKKAGHHLCTSHDAAGLARYSRSDFKKSLQMKRKRKVKSTPLCVIS